MHPSNSANYDGNVDPISFSDQAILWRPNFLNSKQDNAEIPPLPLMFHHFPFPIQDDDIFLQQYHHHHHDLLLQDHQPICFADTTNYNNTVDNNMELLVSDNNINHSKEQHIPRKSRSSNCNRRDRHSKIDTARGPRSRRMRLSLDVARRFFGLQDMLGFDKPSKTVGWLINQAKHEIKKLRRSDDPDLMNNGRPLGRCDGGVASTGTKTSSSTSECTELGVSCLDEVAISGNQLVDGKPSSTKGRRTSSTTRQSGRKGSALIFHPLARESREKARARARERTKEQMRIRRLVHESSMCGSGISSFQKGELESGILSQNMNLISLQAHGQISNPEANSGTMSHDDSFMIMTKWCPSSTSISSQYNFAGIFQHQ